MAERERATRTTAHASRCPTRVNYGYSTSAKLLEAERYRYWLFDCLLSEPMMWDRKGTELSFLFNLASTIEKKKNSRRALFALFAQYISRFDLVMTHSRPHWISDPELVDSAFFPSNFKLIFTGERCDEDRSLRIITFWAELENTGYESCCQLGPVTRFPPIISFWNCR